MGNLRKRVVESTMEATENGSLGFYDGVKDVNMYFLFFFVLNKK